MSTMSTTEVATETSTEALPPVKALVAADTYTANGLPVIPNPVTDTISTGGTSAIPTPVTHTAPHQIIPGTVAPALQPTLVVREPIVPNNASDPPLDARITAICSVRWNVGYQLVSAVRIEDVILLIFQKPVTVAA